MSIDRISLLITESSILSSIFKFTKSNVIYSGDEYDLEYRKGRNYRCCKQMINTFKYIHAQEKGCKGVGSLKPKCQSKVQWGDYFCVGSLRPKCQSEVEWGDYLSCGKFKTQMPE